MLMERVIGGQEAVRNSWKWQVKFVFEIFCLGKKEKRGRFENMTAKQKYGISGMDEFSLVVVKANIQLYLNLSVQHINKEHKLWFTNYPLTTPSGSFFA